MILAILIVCTISLLVFQETAAGTKSKAHAHQGILKQFDGKHIPYTITLEENAKLNAGQSVRYSFFRLSFISYGHICLIPFPNRLHRVREPARAVEGLRFRTSQLPLIFAWTELEIWRIIPRWFRKVASVFLSPPILLFCDPSISYSGSLQSDILYHIYSQEGWSIRRKQVYQCKYCFLFLFLFIVKFHHDWWIEHWKLKNPMLILSYTPHHPCRAPPK